MHDNSFEAFAKAVKESCSTHANRKNYTDNDIDGKNKMAEITKMLGINREHGIAEIIYKAAEYLRTPRRVLLEKISGWAFIVWRDTPE